MIQIDPSKWIVISNNHQPIISKEEYERVQGTVLIKGARAVAESVINRTTQKRIKKDGSAIEHVNPWIKRFKILQYRYRNRCNRHGLRVILICGLHNFEMIN